MRQSRFCNDAYVSTTSSNVMPMPLSDVGIRLVYPEYLILYSAHLHGFQDQFAGP
jgi:hypothetical protein